MYKKYEVENHFAENADWCDKGAIVVKYNIVYYVDNLHAMTMMLSVTGVGAEKVDVA